MKRVKPNEGLYREGKIVDPLGPGVQVADFLVIGDASSDWWEDYETCQTIGGVRNRRDGICTPPETWQ